ncbi:2'-5' RNA ligase family protein [Inquilinus sp.]|uniref:2'-5' RNA ligase family protein n=1 Tax=Inquilinus sp. TaxID=1932117 RepID=UPI0037834943
MGEDARLAVVGYPIWSDADRDWIEAIRQQHDTAKAAMIAAHVTLVFPTGLLAEPVMLDHLRDCLRGTAPIDIDLSAVAPAADASDHYVFLLPGRGSETLTALHDRLYSGPLAPALRPDPPYQPHVTVARLRDAATAASVADVIRRQGRVVRGRVVAMTLLRCFMHKVETIAAVPLSTPERL